MPSLPLQSNLLLVEPALPRVHPENGLIGKLLDALPISEIVSEARTVACLAIPCVLAQVLSYANHVAVIAVVGHLGARELAAASLAIVFSNITGYSFLYGLGSALDTLASQAVAAARRRGTAGLYLQRSLLINFVAIVPISLCWLLATEPLLLLAKQDPDVAHVAAVYVRILWLGLVPNIIGLCITKYLQSMMLMRAPFIIELGGLSIGMCLQALLVYCTPLGVFGAALGSVLVDSVISVALMFYFWTHRGTGVQLALDATYSSESAAEISIVALPNLALNELTDGKYLPAARTYWQPWSRAALRGWGNYICLALPGIAMICSDWWIFEIISLFAGTYGVKYLDAQSAVLSTCVLAFTMHLGLSITCASRIGNLLGANKPRKARLTAVVAFLSSICLAVVVSVTMLSFSNSWGYLFTNDEEVVKIVADLLPICALYQAADGGCCIIGGILRGCGEQKIGAIFNFISYYVIGIPLAVFFAVYLGFGVTGIFFGLAIVLWLNMICLICYAVRKINWEEQAHAAIQRVNSEEHQTYNAISPPPSAPLSYKSEQMI